MTQSTDDPHAVSLGELVATLSLAQDSAFGQPLESELRTCLLALGIARELGLDEAVCHDTYYVALLRYIGCTGHAVEASRLFGDEVEARARTALLDMGNPAEILLEVVRHAGEGQPVLKRLQVLASVLAGGRAPAEENFRTGCEVAELIVDRLGLRTEVRDALWHSFERWNGKGYPAGSSGTDIPLPMRIVHVAQDLEVLERVGSADSALAHARARAGKSYDPDVVDAAVACSAERFDTLAGASPWDLVLAAEPAPKRLLEHDDLDDALRVVADFVDIKSPFTVGHSRGVGELAEAAATQAGLGEGERRAARRAGFVHDLGRTAVPNSIWDKAGSLTHAEWDRVQAHTYLTDRMLARAPGLARLAPVASAHHERIDGSGYHRGTAGAGLTVTAKIVAAADVYQALTQTRPHRGAFAAPAAAAELRSMARSGALDPDATEAVLGGAGHRVNRRRSWPAGLTNREVEVLRLVARGRTTRQIAQELVITEKTAGHHIAHVYTKIGVSTRGAAALFATQHDLVADA